MDENGYVDIISISEIPEDEQCRTWVCYDAYGHLDTRGVDAWDYVRIMRITGLCYQCGYISLEECLDQCLPIAQRLQKEYGSFEEIFESYIYGYQFWKMTAMTTGSIFTGGQREKPSKIFSRSTIQNW